MILIYFVLIAEMSLVVLFYLICQEDYHWWWKTFFVGAFPSLFVTMSVLYNLQIDMSLAKVFWSLNIGMVVGLAGASLALMTGFVFIKVIFKKSK